MLNRYTVDFTNPIPTSFNLIYDLNGAHGNYGRMIIYASVEIYHIDIKYFQRYFVIKLHSLYWNKYELSNRQCCSIKDLKPCDISCDYFVQIHLYKEEFITYNTLYGTKFKENRLYLHTIFAENAPNSKYNISIVLKESENFHIIDIANINPKNYSSTEAFLGINLKGKYDNVNFTVSFGYVCNRYTSPFYSYKCNAIPKIEYCDYKTGSRLCINGAKDIYCERNGLLIKLIISNSIANKKIFCKCNKGYKGKHCENLICRNDCNGNGYCLNKETYACKSIYKGELCNEYPCSENIINPCANGGICYQTNNSIKCFCPFGYINGKYCQTLSCGKKCKNGKCIFSINDGTYRCVCIGRWYGSDCGIHILSH
ncbi:hypothetical protein HZS_4103 [Henneguya salminicola]|nr:hypothetical protein HZS_4103 [Henneguya salminicola]